MKLMQSLKMFFQVADKYAATRNVCLNAMQLTEIKEIEQQERERNYALQSIDLSLNLLMEKLVREAIVEMREQTFDDIMCLVYSVIKIVEAMKDELCKMKTQLAALKLESRAKTMEHSTESNQQCKELQAEAAERESNGQVERESNAQAIGGIMEDNSNLAVFREFVEDEYYKDYLILKQLSSVSLSADDMYKEIEERMQNSGERLE